MRGFGRREGLERGFGQESLILLVTGQLDHKFTTYVKVR